jgi:predicted oxidoreductase (fatty acid repression mutant protein)
MIPLVSLRTEPFNLVYQDRVIIKILAHNLRGWSDAFPLNDESTAPMIQTEPLKMQPTTEGIATSRSVIEIKWD